MVPGGAKDYIKSDRTKCRRMLAAIRIPFINTQLLGKKKKKDFIVKLSCRSRALTFTH